jgi:hypothetical protein
LRTFTGTDDDRRPTQPRRRPFFDEATPAVPDHDRQFPPVDVTPAADVEIRTTASAATGADGRNGKVQRYCASVRSIIGLRWPEDETEPGPWVRLRELGITPDTWQSVKDVALVMATYSNLGDGARPAQGTVGDILGVSHTYAAKLIRLACAAGLLREVKKPVRGRAPGVYDLLDVVESPLWVDYFADDGDGATDDAVDVADESDFAEAA